MKAINSKLHGSISAFTLIELFAVVVLTLILAALLWPPSRVKPMSQGVKCMSNLKMITLAGIIYMSDTGKLIIEADTNDLNSWVGNLGPYGVTSNVLVCPKTQIPAKGVSSGANIIGAASSAWCQWPSGNLLPTYGSYSINGWLFSYNPSFSNTYWGPIPAQVISNPQFLFSKPTSVQHPSQTPFFNDAVVWNEWPLETDRPAPDLSQGAAGDITGISRCTIWRHGGKTATTKVGVQHLINPPQSIMPKEAGINIGFDDGHAQMVKLNDLWMQSWHNNWKPSATAP